MRAANQMQASNFKVSHHQLTCKSDEYFTKIVALQQINIKTITLIICLSTRISTKDPNT